MKTYTLYFVIFAVLIGGGFLYYDGARQQKEALEELLPPPPAGGPENTSFPPLPNAPVEIGAEDHMMTPPGSSNNGEENGGGAMEGGMMEAAPLKEFTIEAKKFEFSVKEIRVKKGDFVRINLKSVDGFHDWVVDAFNAATKQINTGGSSSVDFKADKTGTFEFYCSVGTHRQMGMVGKLIIE